MTDININDLNSSGSDLFEDSESFLYDLSDTEEGIVGAAGFTINAPVSIQSNIVVGSAAISATNVQSASAIQTVSRIG